MLTRVTEAAPAADDVAVPIARATYPAPFPSSLEFNAPVHGTWNIVHTGMLVPGAHQIYVCGQNCIRGVVMTAAEMNALDRFSLVVLDEMNLVDGDLEKFTVEGVADVIDKLPEHPPVVLLFTVCVHHFAGCDIGYVYRSLRQRFPDIFFAESYMDPIRQKEHLTPEQKLRRSMFDALEKRPFDRRSVSVLGSDFALDEDADLLALIRGGGFEAHQIQDCRTFSEYQRLAASPLIACTYPTARFGIETLCRRLGARCLYLPSCFGYEENVRHLGDLAYALGMPRPDCDDRMLHADKELEKARHVVGERRIVIDQNVHPRPLGLARLLVEHGFSVWRVHLDSVRPEEKDDFYWLAAHAPDLELLPLIQPSMRVAARGCDDPVLAIGQWAAWFADTPHFVNLVEGGGLWGFSGICHLARLMVEAMHEEKDTHELVQLKGLGCESCI